VLEAGLRLSYQIGRYDHPHEVDDVMLILSRPPLLTKSRTPVHPFDKATRGGHDYKTTEQSPFRIT